MRTAFPPSPLVVDTVAVSGRTYTWDENTFALSPQFIAMETNVLLTANKSAANIVKGMVVKRDGNLQGKPTVSVADASAPGLVLGIAGEDFDIDVDGLVVTGGKLRGVDTSAFPGGTELWLSGVGGYTATKPTTDPVRLGFVLSQHAVDGVIFIDLNADPIATNPYGVCFTFPDMPLTTDIATHAVVATATFPANLTGSSAVAEVNATAIAVFSIKKNGTEVGTVTLPAGTFSSTGFSLVAGDKLSVHAPTVSDATLSGVGITLMGTR